MEDVSITPYLFFGGNAKEAMEFYKSVFGGELTVSTIGDSPPEAQMPGTKPSDVMHAELKAGGVHLFASDSQKASNQSAKVELSINGSDDNKMHQIWDKLGADGKVTMPLEKQFWGDTFGMLTDKYGVDWMMNIAKNKS